MAYFKPVDSEPRTAKLTGPNSVHYSPYQRARRLNLSEGGLPCIQYQLQCRGRYSSPVCVCVCVCVCV